MGAQRRFGAFDLGEELGRGAFGVVYRAVERSSGREVALKLLLATEGERAETRLQRFAREGQVAGALDHPGIVPVVGAGTEAGHPWIAFELVPGARTLEQVFREASRAERVERVRETVEAIAAAHEAGVVHRDLKPSNVLVDAAGRARVTDFGLAAPRGAARLTQTGDLVGSPFAMAPEQAGAERDAVGPATDVWGLGVLLYQALTGRQPFVGGTLIELLLAIRERAPAPPRELDPAVSPALEAVCLRCLAKAPGDRYPHAGALAAALDEALSPTASVSGPASGIVAAVALGGLALGVGAVLALRAAEPAPPDPPRTELAKTSPEPPSSPSPSPAPTPATGTRTLTDEQAAQVAAADALLAKLAGLDPDSPASRSLVARAVEAAPFYGRALYHRGVARARQRRFTEGLADLERADACLVPYRERRLYVQRGTLYALRKRWKAAVTDLRRAYDPARPRLAGIYGSALREAGESAEAERVLRRLWEEHRPDDWRIPYNLAAAMRQLKRTHAEVYPYAKAAVEVSRGRAVWPLVRLGSTCLYMGRYDEALRFLDRARPLLPARDRAAYFAYAGRAQLRQGRRAEAVRLWRQGLASPAGHYRTLCVDGLKSLGER